jgi:hypothetical protein
VKSQYKQTIKDHKVKEGALKESHERMVAIENEHKNLKRKLIAVKNGIDITPPPHPREDIAKAIAMSQETYNKHTKKEESRIQTVDQQLEKERQRVD